MGRVKIGKSGLKPSRETRLNGLKLIGLVGNEKYGCDRSTDGNAGEVRRNVATFFTSRESKTKVVSTWQRRYFNYH